MWNNHKHQVNLIWILCGAYLIYLGIKLLTAVCKEANEYEWIWLVAGVVFLGVGGYLFWREWKAYRRNALLKEEELMEEETDDPEIEAETEDWETEDTEKTDADEEEI